MKLKTQKLFEKVLEQMKDKPMTRIDITKAMGMTKKGAEHHITTMKRKRLIYICKYEPNSVGTPIVYYMAGNKPDVAKPKPKTVRDYNAQAKRKREQRAAERVKPFTPRPDIAAAWLWNSIC